MYGTITIKGNEIILEGYNDNTQSNECYISIDWGITWCKVGDKYVS